MSTGDLPVRASLQDSIPGAQIWLGLKTQRTRGEKSERALMFPLLKAPTAPRRHPTRDCSASRPSVVCSPLLVMVLSITLLSPCGLIHRPRSVAPQHHVSFSRVQIWFCLVNVQGMGKASHTKQAWSSNHWMGLKKSFNSLRHS